MTASDPILATLLPLVDDLSRDLPEAERFRRLLGALRRLVPCDASALLRLEGGDLVPLAVDGLSVDTRCLKLEDGEPISGNKMKQPVKVREGIEQELAKKIVKLLKDSKMKVQGSIQGDVVRVSGAKKDLLQDAIALIRKSINEFPLQFKNFRD